MPTVSSPSESVFGRRPVATSTFSTSMVSPLSSTAFAPPPVTARSSTFVPVKQRIPRADNTFASAGPRSSSISGSRRGSISTTVTSTPNGCSMQANSQPITPPPTISRLWGSASQCSASSLVQTTFGSSGQPEIRDGTDPTARMTLSAVISSPSAPSRVTAILPAPFSTPRPWNALTPRPPNSDLMPPRSFLMTMSLRF